MAENETLVYSVEQASKLLQISRNSCYLAIKSGAIPSLKIGARILIPRAALFKFLENAGQPVTNANKTESPTTLGSGRASRRD